jgi:hypothetical protein
MTVAELRELLFVYPPNFEVRLDSENGSRAMTREDVYRADFRPVVYIGMDLDQEE